MTANEYGNSVEFFVNEPGPGALFTFYAPNQLFTVSGARICFQLPRLKGQLASMTPAQRNAQALWESGLTSADSPNGRPYGAFWPNEMELER
jgi:hypothetical protein